MGESKGEGGSWLFGIILILAGGFIVVTGILTLFGETIVTDFLPDNLDFMVQVTGYTDLGMGAWGIIGGVGLIKDQEWGWGISLVVLSVVIIKFISEVISKIITMAWSDITLWIKLAAIIVAGVGIVYLLLTKYKYA